MATRSPKKRTCKITVRELFEKAASVARKCGLLTAPQRAACPTELYPNTPQLEISRKQTYKTTYLTQDPKPSTIDYDQLYYINP